MTVTAEVLDGTVRATVVLVGGHESNEGRALPSAGSPAGRATSSGRGLAQAVGEALDQSALPVCVVPMTLGRDPEVIADTARTLRWLTRGASAGRVVLAEPFGTASHLTGWLRAAAGRVAADVGKAELAVLVTAPPADVFADAELFRIARLVWAHGRARWVDVAFDGGDPDLAEGVDRCRRLGARHVALVPAGFGPAARVPVAGAIDGRPLLTTSAIAGVVAARVAAALHRLGHGDDGIAAGLDAEHGHGHAHSHGLDSHGSDGHGQSHSHSHAQPH